jgi:hypothetical protein
MEVTTRLGGVSLDSSTRLVDVGWNGVALTRIDWEPAEPLGDESLARQTRDITGRPKDKETQLTEFLDATRASRQLATVLRGQGLSEHADRFAYRAQVLQRQALCRQVFLRQRGRRVGPSQRLRKLAVYFGSWFLFLIAGYGYRPLRTLSWYLAVIFGFAVIFFSVGPGVGVPLSPLGALVFSITSFHGRGFFPGGSPGHSVTLDDPLTVMAALEAVVGLFIEVSFIATFTQRYFGK